MNDVRLQVAVVGASGYAGGELCRLLLEHPAVGTITPLSRSEEDFERVHANLLGSGLVFHGMEALERGLDYDFVFMAASSGTAMALADAVVARGSKVIDLSADFRFASQTRYEEVYDREHTAAHLLPSAVYGAPELYRSAIANATLIANPGCFALTSILGLAPLYEAGFVRPDSFAHISALNGTTGAGTTPRLEILHAEVVGSVLPYSLDGHRHAPEIELIIGEQIGTPPRVDFTTAHGDFARGVFVQASVELADEYRSLTRDEILDVFALRYANEPFVRVNRQPSLGGKTDKDYRRLPGLANVVGSNSCQIGVDVDRERGLVRVVAVMDNLMKGAAGNAIQNMNIMAGIAETDGLTPYGL